MKLVRLSDVVISHINSLKSGEESISQFLAKHFNIYVPECRSKMYPFYALKPGESVVFSVDISDETSVKRAIQRFRRTHGVKLDAFFSDGECVVKRSAS